MANKRKTNPRIRRAKPSKAMTWRPKAHALTSATARYPRGL